MFEDALLESSPRRASVLSRIHYLIAALTGALFFAQSWYFLPWVLAPATARALGIAAGLVGAVAALYALMLCYVWADTRQQHGRTWPWCGVTLLLNLPGFLIYLVTSARKTGDWKRAAIPLAYVAESIAVGVLILVPLIHTQALPRQLLSDVIRLPEPPPGPPPAHPAGPPPRPTPHPAVDLLHTHIQIPVGVTPVVETPEPAPDQGGTGLEVVGAIPGGGTPGGNWTGVIGGFGSGTPQPPPPPPAHPAPKPQMIRVGGQVIGARALYRPSPDYPPLARMARIQGTVVLQAIIGRDGTVQDLKVLSGHPLLIHAALDAVKSWRYQPTLLNGDPVDVLTEVDVNFDLTQ